MFFFKNAKKRVIRKKGFTLIELIVVCALMAIMSGVVVFNHRSFSSRVTVSNAAYELAHFFREAQLYGAGVIGSSVIAGENRPTGVSFKINGNNEFVMFTDSNSNKAYLAANDASIKTYKLPSGMTASVCRGVDCETSSWPGLVLLHVTFIRPSFDASFRVTNNGNHVSSAVGGESLNSITLTISLDGDEKKVTINTTGLIYVHD